MVDPWVEAFHAGERGVLAECYREHFDTVLSAAKRVVGHADAETIAHEVFFRLLSEPEMRAGFLGGNIGAWLSVVARRCAIDLARRLRREIDIGGLGDALDAPSQEPDSSAEEADAKMLIDRFQREVLPAKYQALFELRFLKQLSQREAARSLGIMRTTLVYQEGIVRRLLEKFLLEGAS